MSLREPHGMLAHPRMGIAEGVQNGRRRKPVKGGQHVHRVHSSLRKFGVSHEPLEFRHSVCGPAFGEQPGGRVAMPAVAMPERADQFRCR